MKIKYRRLVLQHQQRVYSLAVNLLQNPAEAEDVTQEAYIKLWKNIGEVDEPRAGGWLLAVTRNLCIDVLRARKVSDDVDGLSLECQQESGRPQNATALSRLSVVLQNAVGALKEPYRSLVIMSDVQQRPQREIADTLGLSLSQVKVYLHRAREKLRRRLQEYAP